MKNTPKNILTASALIAGLAGMSSVAQAQIEWTAGDTNGDFATGSNWAGNVAPTNGGIAHIGNGNAGNPTASATYSTGTTALNTLNVGFAGTTTGTLNITGGTLTGATNLGSNNDASGNINLSGGTLGVNGGSIGGSSATSTLTLNGGTWQDGGSTSFFQIQNNAHLIFNSGTVNSTANEQHRFRFGNLTGAATFEVNGSASSLDFGNLQFNGTNGIINWNFNTDAAGVSAFNSNSFDFIANDDGESLNVYVDLADYGSTNTIVLMQSTFSTWDASLFDNLEVTGGTGDFVFTDVGFGTQLTLENIVIPEPGTYALIGGCFALSAVMLRRRRS